MNSAALLSLFVLIQCSMSVELTQCIPINYHKLVVKGMDIIHTYPHDPTIFTQGLYIKGNELFESSGLYGKSKLVVNDKVTAMPMRQRKLAKKYFAEGIVGIPSRKKGENDEIYQLTWKERMVFVYDSKTLKMKRRYNLPYQIKEGWGMTYFNNSIVVSDGTNKLYFVDPYTFTVSDIVSVYRGNAALKNINELEVYKGYIMANVWFEDVIVFINPNSGKVDAELWCNVKRGAGEDVLNGLAFNKTSNSLLITGKLWDKLYEAVLV